MYCSNHRQFSAGRGDTGHKPASPFIRSDLSPDTISNQIQSPCLWKIMFFPERLSFLAVSRWEVLNFTPSVYMFVSSRKLLIYEELANGRTISEFRNITALEAREWETGAKKVKKAAQPCGGFFSWHFRGSVDKIRFWLFAFQNIVQLFFEHSLIVDIYGNLLLNIFS